MHTYWLTNRFDIMDKLIGYFKWIRYLVKQSFYRLSLIVYPETLQVIEPDFYACINEIRMSISIILRTHRQYHNAFSWSEMYWRPAMIPYNPDELTPDAMRRRLIRLNDLFEQFKTTSVQLNEYYEMPPLAEIQGRGGEAKFSALRFTLLTLYTDRQRYLQIELYRLVKIRKEEVPRVVTDEDINFYLSEAAHFNHLLRLSIEKVALGQQGEFLTNETHMLLNLYYGIVENIGN